MTALEHLNNLAAYMLAPEEEGGKKYTYTEIADMLYEIKQDLTKLERLEYAKKNWKFDFTEQGLYEYVMFGEIKI